MTLPQLSGKWLLGDLKRRVEAGRSGERFTPIRMLMAEYGTSQRKIEAALQLLIQEGALCRVPHQGYYIANRSQSKVKKLLFLCIDWSSQALTIVENELRRLCEEAGDVVLTRRNYPAHSRPLRQAALEQWDMVALYAYAPPFQAEELFDLANSPCPVAVLDKNLEEISVSSVNNQDELSGLLAADCLIRNGHRRLLVMNAEPQSANIRLRISGFIRYAELHRTQVRVLDSQTVSGEDSGTKACECLLRDLSERPLDYTGLFVTSDGAALGVYKAVQMRGYRIPEDISIVGHDNSQIAALLHPALTSVAVDYRRQAQALFQGLNAQYRNRNSIFQYHAVPYLAEHDSVIALHCDSSTQIGIC